MRFLSLLLLSAGIATNSPPGPPGDGLPFIDDDYPRALEQASARHLPLFVDGWAPWCHTCRFMRANVFADAALTKHAGQFVWLSMDTEKPSAVAFLEKFPMDSWPTLFVIDPITQQAELRWAGTANVQQLEKLLEDGEFAVHRAWAHQQANSACVEDALAEADQLQANGDHMKAAKKYRDLLNRLATDAPRRGRVVESLVSALMDGRDLEGCASYAQELTPQLPQGSSFASAATAGLRCALDAANAAPWAKRAIAVLEPLVKQALAFPGLLADDRSGLYELLVEHHEQSGDQDAVRTLSAKWWDFLEQESSHAKTAEARAALDSHRVLAAQKLGDPARAIAALEASERDLPADYNAPARLAVVYRSLGRYDAALAANQRALARVYGPRRLRILEIEAGILADKGDRAGARKVLSDALAEASSIPSAQRSAEQVRRLRAALDELQK